LRKNENKFENESLANVKICSTKHSHNVKRALLWHRKIGHVNFQTLHEMSKEGLVLGLPKLPHDHIYDIC
jgi:hypothetical protein